MVNEMPQASSKVAERGRLSTNRQPPYERGEANERTKRGEHSPPRTQGAAKYKAAAESNKGAADAGTPKSKDN